MNSLNDLNIFGSELIPFIDNRAFRVYYSKDPGNTISTGYTDYDYNLQIVNYDFIESITGTGTLVLNIDVGSTGATVDWGSLSAGISVTQNGNVYTATFSSVAEWKEIQQETVITPPSGFDGSYTINLELRWQRDIGPEIILRWSTENNITFYTTELSDPDTSYYVSNNTFQLINPPLINTPPLLSSTFTLVIDSPTNNLTGMYSLINPGIGVWDAVAKTYTVTGNYTEINQHLSSAFITFNAVTGSPTLRYTLTNNTVGIPVAKTQSMVQATWGLSGGTTFSFDENPKTIPTANKVVVSEQISTTYTVTLSFDTQIDNVTNTDTAITGVWNGSTYVFSGSLTQINNHLAGITITNNFHNSASFTLTYDVVNGFSQSNQLVQTVNVPYAIEFLPNIAINQTITTLDGSGQHILPVGISITELRNINPGLEYRIDLSNVGIEGAITWPNVAGVSFSQIDGKGMKWEVQSPLNQSIERIAVNSNFVAAGEQTFFATQPNKIHIFNKSNGALIRTISATGLVYSSGSLDYSVEHFPYEMDFIGNKLIVTTKIESGTRPNTSSGWTVTQQSGHVYVYDVTTGLLDYKITNPVASSDLYGYYLSVSDSGYFSVSAPLKQVITGNNTWRGVIYTYNLTNGSLVSSVSSYDFSEESLNGWGYYHKMYGSTVVSRLWTNTQYNSYGFYDVLLQTKSKKLFARPAGTALVTDKEGLSGRQIQPMSIDSQYMVILSDTASGAYRVWDHTNIEIVNNFNTPLISSSYGTNGNGIHFQCNGIYAFIPYVNANTSEGVIVIQDIITGDIKDQITTDNGDNARYGYRFAVTNNTVACAEIGPSSPANKIISSYKYTPGIEVASNINTIEEWNAIKNPTVKTRLTDNAYTVTISYPEYEGSTSKSWTVNVDLP